MAYRIERLLPRLVEYVHRLANNAPLIYLGELRRELRPLKRKEEFIQRFYINGLAGFKLFYLLIDKNFYSSNSWR